MSLQPEHPESSDSKPKSHYEIAVKTIQVRIYTDHPDNYAAAFNASIEGERATIWGLIGQGAYEAIAPHFNEFINRLGLRCVEAVMLAPHVRLLRFRFRRIARVEVIRDFERDGRAFSWIEIIPK